MAKGIFDDPIIHDTISINESPPFLTASLPFEKIRQNQLFWSALIESQLESIFSSNFIISDSMPSKFDFLNSVTRDNPFRWDPVCSLKQYEYQSVGSFEEQKLALQFNVQRINKYTTTIGKDSQAYTKNVITFGAPGTEKSFIGQLIALYTLSQGLNVISIVLMGTCANSLGGIHMHRLFPFPTNINLISLFRCAEYALQKIKRNTKLHHGLLSLDILFFDKLAQISTEQIATIDIIM